MTLARSTLAAAVSTGPAPAASRDQAIGALLGLLEEGDEADRCYAAQALGHLRANAAVTALTRHLADEDVDVCVDAAAALAEIGDVSALTALEATLRGDPDPEVKTAAMAALGVLAGTGQVPLLVEMARAQPDNIDTDYASEWDPWWDIQLTAVRALGRLRDGRAVEVLDALLEDEDGQDIEAELLLALARIEDGGEQRVEARLGSADPRQRRRCVVALAQSGTAESLKSIGRALLDQDPEVRATALEAVAGRRARRFLPVVLTLFRDPETRVRDTAVRVCETLIAGSSSDTGPGADEAPIDSLCRQTHDADPRVRAAALRALASVARDPRLAGEVERLLWDQDPEVLEAACTVSPVCPQVDADVRLLALAAAVDAATPVRRAALQAIAARGCWNFETARLYNGILEDTGSDLRLTALTALLQLQRSRDDGQPPAGAEELPQPLSLVLAALGGECVGVRESQADGHIPVEIAGTETAAAVVTPVELPAVAAGEVRPAVSSLESIAIDNAEVALALAEHARDEQQSGEDLEGHLAEFVALTEQNERTSRWLFAREGLERDLDVRRLAARVLKGCPRAAVASALIAALDDEDSTLQGEALAALAEIAAATQVRADVAAAGDRIERFAGNEDRKLRMLAIRTLHRGGCMAAGPFFQALADPEPTVRCAALAALESVVINAADRETKQAGSVFEAARRALGDPAANVRLAAARTLTRLDAHGCSPMEAGELAAAIVDAVFTGTGGQARAFAGILRAWNLEAASAACLNRLAAFEHSVDRRYAIEILEELHLNA